MTTGAYHDLPSHSRRDFDLAINTSIEERTFASAHCFYEAEKWQTNRC
jgi:hypothetical protein